MTGEKLSVADARRAALAAQGFSGPRTVPADRRALRGLVEKLGVVQIDSVNVLVRSHYLPAFSRLGGYDRDAFDALAHRAPRAVFEYWAHEASLVPIALHPLLRWRMARAHEHAWGRMRRIARKKPGLVADVLAIVRDNGPVAASDIEVAEAKKRRKRGWWEWSETKTVTEWLFWSGELTSARRRGFERLYDLPDRVIPARVLAAPTPSEADAQRALVAISARALAVATEADLRDYFRLPLAATRTAIRELVDAGELVPAQVEGWRKPAYLHRDADIPRAIDATRAALLSPFDNLIWMRDRTHRLFGMQFRLEIYVPASKRVHGYYVLPLLVGDELAARVDLKADRAAGVLRVQAAHAEPGFALPRTARTLAPELAQLARWLGLERVEAMRRGDLAPALARALRD
ncbi:MAG TPA: crosslink repair DNA glycosylase YcaQ family protein [Kofleriaceae bacterium]|nr:crosslink repair DNA glycosylase YcaQ family protein [Kofleriaceae bacterium]